jgi:outer membrane biosynthesis protein TonB
MRSLYSSLYLTAAAALLQIALATAISAQSVDPNFPTPVETSEIKGVIRARDVGDSRLTSHFYTFDGGQGDIFINVVTSNFAGDIDVFAADALRPLTKMVIYPDGGSNETGRLVYLRKGERLILRVEGRSPNDDPATYRIKLGGSFIALTGQKVEDAPTIARAEKDEESGIKVNSVGTIVPVPPKPKPPKATVTAETKPPTESKPAAAKTVAKAKPPVKKPPVVITTVDPGVATVFGKKPARSTTATTEKKPPVKAPAKSKVPAKSSSATTRPPKPPAKPAEPSPDPMAGIGLVVQLKDGNVLERPMSEVLRFSVDKGFLTVIGKDGKAERYPILDVSRVSMEPVSP